MRGGCIGGREWAVGLKTLIVGDIHGCIDELLDLVEAAALRAGDRLISLGDIINKGPAPEEVFEFLSRRPNTLILMGNHEARHLELPSDGSDAAPPERIARAQFSEAAYRRFLAAAREFPLYEELPEALVLHGYFEGGLPLERQKPHVLMGRERGRARLAERGLWPWYDHYDHPKPIVVGHKAYRENGEAMIVPGRIYAIDTKCCEGGALTGLLLPGFEIVSVPARRDHWRVIQMAWGSFDPGAGGRFTLPRLRPDIIPLGRPPVAPAVAPPAPVLPPLAEGPMVRGSVRGAHRPWWALGPLGWAWRVWSSRF